MTDDILSSYGGSLGGQQPSQFSSGAKQQAVISYQGGATALSIGSGADGLEGKRSPIPASALITKIALVVTGTLTNSVKVSIVDASDGSSEDIMEDNSATSAQALSNTSKSADVFFETSKSGYIRLEEAVDGTPASLPASENIHVIVDFKKY